MAAAVKNAEGDGPAGAVGDALPAVPAQVDMRSERWREHRATKRRELVDAAFVAIDECGPDASMEQIAERAGIAKPKLYRHFADKADLAQAVSDRSVEMVLAGVVAAADPSGTAREGLHDALDAYLGFVEQHPSVVRFLTSAVGAGRTGPTPIVLLGRMLARIFVTVAALDLSTVDATLEVTEPLAHAMAGAVFGVTDWWINTDDPLRMERGRLVDHLATLVFGTVNAALAPIGLFLDPDGAVLDGHLRRLGDLPPAARPPLS